MSCSEEWWSVGRLQKRCKGFTEVCYRGITQVLQKLTVTRLNISSQPLEVQYDTRDHVSVSLSGNTHVPPGRTHVP